MKNYFNAILILFNNIEQTIKSFGLKKIDIFNSIGNICSFTIISRTNIPYFNNSAMDGFAICHNKTLSLNKLNPKVFTVIDTIIAGETCEFNKFDGNFVVEIMTGARVPLLFDSVIKLEDILFRFENKFEILIHRVVKIGEHVRKIGEDLKLGDILLRKGEIISSSHILSISSIGIKSIYVIKKPKIYLICTGNEIVESFNFNKNNQSSFINNSSAPYMISFFKELGFDIIYLGIVKDDASIFLKKINPILHSKNFSLIITTGAVSKGKADFISNFLLSLGADILFHGINMRPGKPILCAKLKSLIYFFCLPGNIISSIVGLRFFVYPFLRFLLGLSFENPFRGKLVSNYDVVRKYDSFLSAYSYFSESNICVKILEHQKSFKVSTMLESNSFVFLKTNESSKKGDFLDIFFYKPLF